MSFKDKIASFDLGPAKRSWVITASRIGLTARGVIFGIIGGFLIRAFGGRGGVITLTITTNASANATPGLLAEQVVMAVEPPTQDALSRQSAGYGLGYTIGIIIVWGALGLVVIFVGIRIAKKGRERDEST